MIHFVPSWSDRTFRPTDFDDTVHQIKIFKKGNLPLELMLTGYSPNLLSALHSQGLSEVPTWSVFDDIQDTHIDGIRPLSFYDFNWPDGIDKIYTPFHIVVNLSGKEIGRVYFSEEGRITKIERYLFKQLVQTFLIDDRGFVSSIIHYSGGQIDFQDYLDPAGNLRIRQNFKNDQDNIYVNPLFANDFQASSYKNLDQLILEFTRIHLLKSNSPDDLVILAAQSKQNQLIFKALDKQRIVLSYFSNRYDFQDQNQSIIKNELLKSSGLIVDQKSNYQKLKKFINENFSRENKTLLIKKIHELTPYDTRLQLGFSQRERKLTIYWVAKEINNDFSKKIFYKFFSKMVDDENIDLIIAVNEIDKNILELMIIRKISDHFKVDLPSNDYELKQSISQSDENQPLDDEADQLNSDNFKMAIAFYQRFQIKTFFSEESIIASMKKVRLIVDLSQEADLFIQIAGISAGIPQINFNESQYVKDQKNGLIISDLKDLSKAIDYYFVGLKHWNQSLVYSVKKMEQYTDFNLLNRWLKALGEQYE
ncbi:accessory Sec system protein Asp1 [Oenococcus oeni]|uniref:Accessory Sec system protein Asp1 n=1 Tax=Oenococcus oeni TaxID=1247 RepID=A0AAJ2P086_OENOE|nr:accessory Sec system protein Asp1 [Oenococcus oeni]MDV7714429.1 accessory Sec system protein Asp1 [Oenococcus oeni]OIK85170.1 accessory Sec system protein Asp1 [Oenococcus oeni]OIL08428.1 accessory Sec system protein Asp1 [Oenococcus oeni]OIL11232.1 accessory Sec system protein Asp1 [Oenococcus oeni]SYW08398.1 Asp1-like accessory secretory protein [Oenococcus oeni]